MLFAANRAPRPFSREEVALLGSLAALAAVSIVQTRAAAETAEALERLSEAHAAVHRHTAGIERAAAAHDRFAELVLAGGGVDDITAALAELTGGWVVAAGRGRSPARAGTGPGAGAAAGARGGARRGSGRLVRRRRHVGRHGQGRRASTSAPSSSAASRTWTTRTGARSSGPAW